MTGHTGGLPDYCPACRRNPPAFPQCPGGGADLCETCRGHGSLIGEPIPYEELSPRRKQGAAHGQVSAAWSRARTATAKTTPHPSPKHKPTTNPPGRPHRPGPAPQGHAVHDIPRWTNTGTIPPAATELEELATKAGAEDPDATAYRLYEAIRRETAHVSGLEETRGELYACRALIRLIHTFSSDRLHHEDDTAKRIHATISRFNLGDMYRPGGAADRYLIPFEFADQEQP